MTTVGELYDAFKDIERAEDQVKKWERAIAYGAASPETMKYKNEELEFAKEWLRFQRDQEIKL
jgi:lysyl-tRNA synthetase class II